MLFYVLDLKESSSIYCVQRGEK